MSESEALHKFIYGLKSVIKARVLIANPTDINEAMQFAQSLDDVLHPRNPYLRRPAPTYRFGYNRSGAVPMDLDALEEMEKSSGNWMLFKKDLERRMDAVTTVDKLDIGQMSVPSLGPSPHHPHQLAGRADSKGRPTTSPSIT